MIKNKNIALLYYVLVTQIRETTTNFDSNASRAL